MGEKIEWGSGRAVIGIGSHIAFLMVKEPHLNGGLFSKNLK